jgi:2-amino-4-hydroxy-6-hydroxymethyldihydropteridine diphosphokinase
MMHKGLLGLNIDELKKCAPEALQAHTVTAASLALGSNHHAEYYLSRVRENLAKLGDVRLSTAFQNPDFTATLNQPKPDYTNQCVHLVLTAPMTLHQLQKLFKRLEGDCNRQRSLLTANNHKSKELLQAEPIPTRQVTMDIDILLVKLAAKNDNSSEEWVVMANRYPFKAHESAGIVELAAGSGLSF